MQKSEHAISCSDLCPWFFRGNVHNLMTSSSLDEALQPSALTFTQGVFYWANTLSSQNLGLHGAFRFCQMERSPGRVPRACLTEGDFQCGRNDLQKPVVVAFDSHVSLFWSVTMKTLIINDDVYEKLKSFVVDPFDDTPPQAVFQSEEIASRPPEF